MKFDPNTHSLSWYVRQRKLRFPYGVPDVLREEFLRLIFVSSDGLLLEHMADAAREDGFHLDADMHPEDFLALVIADYHAGDNTQHQVWSSLRQIWEVEPDVPPDPEVQGPPYELIYADPPWPYTNKKTGGSHMSGAGQHYTIMPLEWIKALPLRTLAAKKCALFLCATTPLLPDALDTMAAWGFTYKTALYWHKTGRLGLGYWFRGQVEIVLLGIRGKVPAFRCQAPNIVSSRPGRHSAKPAEIRDLIASAAYPVLKGARLEMFSRGYFAGWDVFGDEIDPDIELVDGVWRRRS